MLKCFDLFILLFCGFLAKCSSEDDIQWRSYMQLFAKDSIIPRPLPNTPYDHFMMQFGERDYSKNELITRSKNGSFRQDRNSLTTPADTKSIALLYRPEYRDRDRAEKIAISQTYPKVSRRKRDIIELPANMNLRVNPNITPPPHIIAAGENTAEPQEIVAEMYGSEDTTESLNTLSIVKETDTIIELVYQISALALNNAREKYCNVTSNTTSEFEFHYEKAENKTKASDVLGIQKIIADFSKSIVDNAASNLTEFCQNSETVEAYQSQCNSGNDPRCPRSSKSGVECVINKNPNNVNEKLKTDGEVSKTTLKPSRRKREATNTVTTAKSTQEVKEKKEQKLTEIKHEGKNKTSFKEKVQAMKKERLKEIKKEELTTKSEVVSSTIDSNEKDDKKEPVGRKFNEKRFKVQRSRDASGWEESDTSLDKNIEPEKTLSNTDLLKKVLKLGASSIIDPEKAKTESVEEVENDDKQEKTAESSAESTNTNEDLEATEEDEETAVTKSRKEYNEIDGSSEEEEPAELEKTPKKTVRLKSKRTQKRAKLPKIVELTKLNKEFYSERKWPDGDVIYVIAKLPDYDLDDLRNRLAAVNGILMKKTCVKLREIDPKEAQGFNDYMILDTSAGYVTGRVGGKQNFGSIELFEGGHHKQHTAMMVMAMLGFYFEVSRHDRDMHIRVHNRHIRADKLHHFEKITDEATLDLPYDYKSATHPAWQFWRRVGKKGISTVATYKEQDPDGSLMRALGQNSELLSNTDIIKINSVYGVECFQSNQANKKESVRMLDENDDVIQ